MVIIFLLISKWIPLFCLCQSKINLVFLSIHLAVFISSINIPWKTKEKLLVFFSREWNKARHSESLWEHVKRSFPEKVPSYSGKIKMAWLGDCASHKIWCTLHFGAIIYLTLTVAGLKKNSMCCCLIECGNGNEKCREGVVMNNVDARRSQLYAMVSENSLPAISGST